ncbi:hypothetical protein ACHAXR_008684 [Thalassiosira sp. AJA248-18]
MDPSSPSVGVSHDHASSGRGEETAGTGHPIDPPEEIFEMVSRSSFPSRGYNGRSVHSGDDDDHHLDEFEMEGLVTTSNSRRSSFSSVGAGSISSSRTRNALLQHCAPLMAICSLAWNPQNRTRSAIGLLFFAFLCMVILTENDVSAWHRSFSSDTNRKKGGGGSGPLSKLTLDQQQSLLKKIYGTWTFYDGSAEDRPTKPYMTVANAGNPYLDLPEDKFPEESWQADAVYANHFLDAAEKLVRRGQQAIFTTYHGYGVSDVRVVKNGGEETIDYTVEDADERVSQRMKMFHLEEIDLSTVTSAKELQSVAPSWEKTGGWSTKRSFDGLERRLTHAIMTRTKFTVVITGSWQSMGYGGNHAWQSMPGVFETLLKDLFEKLGVELVVRAIGLPPLTDLSFEEQAQFLDGGKSTWAHTLGWSSIYGSDVDMVVWDDYHAVDDKLGELDQLSSQLFDLFARQALLSGTASLPFIWGGDFNVLRNLHEHADVDVGQLGNGLVGVQETTTEKAANNLPWAARYLNCPESMQNTCQKKENQFESKCWIERSDVTPPIPQLDHIQIVPYAVGWRMQQLKGYTLAFNFLQATLDAINQYSEITISQGFPLPDEYWHMGDYIKNVQEKVKALDETVAPHCFQLQEKMGLPKRLCKHRLKGRTEYTPRANPADTSITTLLDPAQVPKNKPQLLYEGDDIENPIRKIPKGEVDGLEILDLHGKRRNRQRLLSTRNVTGTIGASNDIYNNVNARYHRRTFAITPGAGWKLLHSYGDGCDGSLSSSSACGRISSNSCLLEGHQGSRGGIWGNETTGWLFLRSIKPENGYIALNLEIGSREQSGRALHESIPDSFVFEYAVGGAITTLDKPKLLEKLQQPVPGVALLTVLDNDGVDEAVEVLVPIRVTGCPDKAECQFAVTHVYWS